MRIGEYSEFRVVCGTQNLIRIRKKHLCVHGEDAKRHKTVQISVNNNTTNFKSFLDSFYEHYMEWIKPKKHPTQTAKNCKHI
jgi:hypothetical protein